jgi:hypothetical protein
VGSCGNRIKGWLSRPPLLLQIGEFMSFLMSMFCCVVLGFSAGAGFVIMKSVLDEEDEDI